MVEEKTLVIPGLEREYRYLFLSDTHIISLDGEESEQQLENAIPRRDTLFKDESGRTPEEVFTDWIAYANEQQVEDVYKRQFYMLATELLTKEWKENIMA